MEAKTVRNFILDTDWWSDCDDAMAIRLLTMHHKQQDINLLGISISACMCDSVPSLDAFCQQCGVQVPIGIDLDAVDFTGVTSYQQRLASLPGKHLANNEAHNAVRLYRKLLSQACGEVEILGIGFPQNFSGLLQSPPDDISPLSGMELIKAKVKHLWLMAGKWDEPDGGKEHNFCNNHRASQAAALVCANWPTEITFLGFEVGYPLISGTHIADDDPLKPVMIDHGSANGRYSWDPLLIELAVAGDPAAWSYSCVHGTASVNPDDGSNYFVPSADGRHRYVVKEQPDQWYADKLDQAYCQAYKG